MNKILLKKSLFNKCVKICGSQTALAKRLDVSKQFITSVKNGRRTMPLDKITLMESIALEK